LSYNRYNSRRPNSGPFYSTRGVGLFRDADLRSWLETQSESDFAISLCQFYDSRGGLTEKQLNSAVKLRLRLDSKYDPYGKNVAIGVYIDREKDTIYKLSWKEDGNLETRSLRSRRSDLPYWKDVKDANKRAFFNEVGNGRIEKLSEEELIGIGKRTGICCVCGKALDNEKSIAAGIGPYCLKQQREKE